MLAVSVTVIPMESITEAPMRDHDEERTNVSKPIKRKRWATQRVTGGGERKKRGSILNRFHNRVGSNEKSRFSVNGSPNAAQEGSGGSETGDQERSARRIFFNIPLPDDAKDEDGHPRTDFGRNKIRTAKYTPLSFVPKNLWFQFQTIANVYFLFVIILSVRISDVPEKTIMLMKRNRYSRFLVLLILLLVPCLSYLFCS